METVFDHNITEEEMDDLGLLVSRDKESYVKLYSSDVANTDIARLYRIRGNFLKMSAYIIKCKDFELRQQFFRVAFHH